MHNGFPIRLKSTLGRAILVGMATCVMLLVPTQMFPQASQPDSSAVVLDRVVAVVNNQAILSSDLDEEIQLSVLDRARVGQGVLTRKLALRQLIARALIQQQIRQEDVQAVEPTQPEMDARIMEIRKEVPACVRQNCATEAGWKAFLAAHSLTPERVQVYLRRRVEILRFIEQRFRQGIRINPQEIEAYYHDTLVPQYSAGEAVPAMDTVAPRIEEILLQKQVNILFEDWLRNLRKQGDIEVLDPELETPESGAGDGGVARKRHPAGAKQAAGKLDTEGGGGFNPRINPAKPTPALAADGLFAPISSEIPSLTASSKQPVEKRDTEGGGGFNPRIKPTESTPALAADEPFAPISSEIPSLTAWSKQPAKKLNPAKGTGFSPYINPAKSTRALAPEGIFPRFSPHLCPFSAANKADLYFAWLTYGLNRLRKNSDSAALYQGTTSVVPIKPIKSMGFSPCGMSLGEIKCFKGKASA